MAFNPRANCKTCMAIMAESPDDPSKSKLFGLVNKVHLGTLKMTVVQREYPEAIPNYQGFRNHCLKHQNVSETQLAKKATRESTIGLRRRRKYEEARKAVTHTERRSSALEQLQEMMDRGELKGATYSALAALLKQEADIEEKQKDRTHEMQKLFATYIANPLPARSAVEWGDVVEGELGGEAD